MFEKGDILLAKISLDFGYDLFFEEMLPIIDLSENDLPNSAHMIEELQNHYRLITTIFREVED